MTIDASAHARRSTHAGRIVAGAQGALYVATGLWPVLHFRSFEAITGPKKEKWLVRTMGMLIASLGAGLLVSVVRERPIPTSVRTAGALAACALGLADVWYVAKGRISRTYLLDSLLEAAIVGGWFLAATESTHRRSLSRSCPR